MTPHRWARISELFATASELPREQRSAYLQQVCPDETLRREVESLLPYAGGPNFLAAPTSLTGKILSHYEIGDLLGGGGMGVVYRARDTRLGRLVALKFLPPFLRNDPTARWQLENEARHASALNHPNIVTVYEVARESGIDFIAMEYVEGRTLDGLVLPNGAPLELVLGWAIQIVDALRVAHMTNILHADLKPSNIMVTGDGRVKLLDFGLARLRVPSPQDPSRSSVRFGTTTWMAPEQLVADPPADPNQSSEIFSFGLILYQMLSGCHPFAASERKETLAAIRAKEPPSLSGTVPLPLALIVQTCLEKLPEKRFPSMQALLDDLHECQKAADSDRSSALRSAKDGAEVETIRLITTRITYENVAKSRQALVELKQVLRNDASELAREVAIDALRDLILTIDPDDEVNRQVRAVRTLIFDALKLAARGDLGRLFQEGELERLDLFQINFAGEALARVSFQECFLVESTFEKSDLSHTCFAAAWIRNVNLAGANLKDADLTDADWFNALGLTEEQLTSARRETLRDCPATVADLHRYLGARYGISFDAWTARVQEQLKAAWAEYLRPRGLRDIAAQWRGNPR